MTYRPVIIIGAGGHAKVLITVLKTLQRDIVGLLDADATKFGHFLSGIRIIGDDDKISDYAPDSVELVNGIGSVSSTKNRMDIFMKFKKHGYTFATVVYPSAVNMSEVTLGEGVQIMAGAIIQAGCTIGDNSIINTGAIIDHDCTVGRHVHIAPGVTLSGDVHVEPMAHVGTAATVIQGIKIGAGAIVGAGAVVLKNIPPGQKVAGVPAQTIG